MEESIRQIWVKYFQTDVTVPLYQKALRKDIDLNIVKLLQTVLPDSREHEEKDSVSLQILKIWKCSWDHIFSVILANSKFSLKIYTYLLLLIFILEASKNATFSI